MTGSVKIIADGPIGGFLRFDNSKIGVAGVGASGAVQDAIFPARHQVRGIRTGMAIRNLKKDAIVLTCQMMCAGRILEEKEIPLAGNGQTARFIHELFSPDRNLRIRGIGALHRARRREVHRIGPGDGCRQPHLHDLALRAGPAITRRE